MVEDHDHPEEKHYHYQGDIDSLESTLVDLRHDIRRLEDLIRDHLRYQDLAH